MKKIIFPLWFTLFTLLASCAQVSSLTPIITPFKTKEWTVKETSLLSTVSSPSITPTLTTSPTIISAVKVTPTPSPSEIKLGTPTIPPEAKLKIQCLNIESNLPPEIVPHGILVLDSQVDRGTYLLNMATREQVQITQPNEDLIDLAVSPDGSWIAYRQVLYNDIGERSIGDNLVIANADNQQSKIIPWEGTWGLITAWLDNQNIVIDIPPDDSEAEAATLLVLDPFIGESQKLAPDFQDIYSFSPVPYWKGWGETVYDPELSRVVYLQGGESGSPSPISYVLWDMQNNQKLANIRIVADLNSIPRWSIDGNRFALAPSLFTENMQEVWPAYEVYSVSRDGQVTQLSHLTDYYQWVYISDLSWSPDGRYIAFWLSSWSEKPSFSTHSEQYLAVLDTDSGMVTNYCIPGDYDAQLAGIRMVPPPLWSPDGKQLVVQNIYTRMPEPHSRVILVDIEKNIAAVIAGDMLPVGWMINP
jgi:Tol biopolymer transport system component